MEESHIARDPAHLIVWKESSEILGHAIWHESNTEEHVKGDPRDEDDRKILRTLVAPGKEFVELHEVWLKTEYRGKAMEQGSSSSLNTSSPRKTTTQ